MVTLGAVAFAAFAVAPAHAQGQPGTAAEGVFEYPVRVHDTLYDLAAKYMDSTADWVTLQKLNHVQHPRRLQPDSILRIPAAMLRRAGLSARVIAVTGVAERANGMAPPTELTVGQTLSEGDHVRTLGHAFATIELSNGSHCTLSPDTAVAIRRLRRVPAIDSVDQQLEIDNGEIETKVSPLKPRDRFDIVTPSAIAGVRGTEFRVAYGPASGNTTVAVLEGKVGVSAEDAADEHSAVLVPRGFGVLANAQGSVGMPTELLSPPILTDPRRIQDRSTLSFDVAALPGATGYRATIATDAGFLNVIDDASVHGSTRVALKAQPPGSYFVRVSAFDQSGIEGLSRVYAFRRINRSSDKTTAGDDGNLEFRWTDANATGSPPTWHFLLATDSQLDHPVIEQHDLVGNRLVLSNLPFGKYYWTVRAETPTQGDSLHPASSILSFSVGQ
jgi:hypothetical protein